MQLESIKISNLLSFPYLEDFEKSEKISFCDEKTGGVNILIGPNGSGKTNFLEIINQIFKVGLVTDYVYNKDIPLNRASELKSTIQINKIELGNMRKNFLYPDKEAKVEITLLLSNNDFDNLGFVCKNNTVLNDIITKYGNFDFFFPDINIETLKSATEITATKVERKITFELLFDLENKTITINKEKLNEKQRFILYYMQDFELIQICMDIYNNFEKKAEDKEFYPLKNTFAILGSNRNFETSTQDYESFTKIDPTSWSNYLTNQNTKSRFTGAFGYFLCLNKLVPASILPPFLPGKEGKTQNSEDDINIFYHELNQITTAYLDIQIDVKQENGKYFLGIKDENGFYQSFTSLSSGKQSVLMTILTIFGYDMENGLMIIDEPELHLHPQFQKLFLRMVNHLSRKYGIQFILATHSPIMINESNIRNVYKFSRQKTGTVVQAPLKHINEDESSLVQMLKFENMSKIFFVDKIIAVEGMTDTYFMGFYLDYLSQTPRWKGRIKEYEILDIQGKGSFRMWKKFLNRFGVQTYFIGDRDNIIENGIMTDQDLNYYRSMAKQQSRKMKDVNPELGNKRLYTVLVYTIKKLFPEKYKYITDSIEKLYANNTFIFQKGDLESYLGLEYKGLDRVVDFCETYFQNRLHDANFDEERQELENMFSIIFK